MVTNLWDIMSNLEANNKTASGVTSVAQPTKSLSDLLSSGQSVFGAVQSYQEQPTSKDVFTQSLSASPYAAQYKNSPYYKYFSGAGIEAGATSSTGLATLAPNQYAQTILSAPEKVTLDWLNQNFKGAQYLSPEVKQAFADNYRLGLASLYEPTDAAVRLPWNTDSGDFQYRYGENDEGRYYSIQPGELSKIGFDPVKGFNLGTATVSQPRSNWFIENIANPILKPALIAGVTAGAGMGLNNLISGLGQAAGTAGASTGVGAGGALGGAGAEAALGTGMITSPAGLSSLVSAAPIGTTIPAAAGGFLNPALAGGLAGAGAAAGGALSGGLPDFNLPFQSPGSIQPIGESTGLGSVGSTAPDLGTGMITSPEGLSGLVNSQPIGTTLGAATPGTTGGYLVPSLGGEALATTAAAGGLASSASSITDWLGNVFNQGVDKFMSDPLKNTLNLVSGISSYLGNNAQAKALEDYLKQGLSQSDPFGSQRAYYMDRLKSTYTNPEGYLKSPEYSAISKRRLEALERADAAQGRRSQYGARTEKMHEFDLENLTKERTMLAQLAGSGINPSQVSSLLGSLGTGSAQAQANAPGNLLFMLNEIFGGKK